MRGYDDDESAEGQSCISIKTRGIRATLFGRFWMSSIRMCTSLCVAGTECLDVSKSHRRRRIGTSAVVRPRISLLCIQSISNGGHKDLVQFPLHNLDDSLYSRSEIAVGADHRKSVSRSSFSIQSIQLNNNYIQDHRTSRYTSVLDHGRDSQCLAKPPAWKNEIRDQISRHGEKRAFFSKVAFSNWFSDRKVQVLRPFSGTSAETAWLIAYLSSSSTDKEARCCSIAWYAKLRVG